MIALGCNGDGAKPARALPPATPSSVRSPEPVLQAVLTDSERVACRAMADVFRAAARTIGADTTSITVPRDTTMTFDDSGPAAREPACVVAWTDSANHTAPLADVYARLAASGWRDRSRLLDASGPDGEVLAYSRGAVACVVRGSWDGGDDSDSTHAAGHGFEIGAACFNDRPDRPDAGP
jgi:hypothetical protein